MKKILTALMVAIATGALAQSWRPMVEEGKTWSYQADFDMFPHDFAYSMTVVGDTVVDGHACKKLFRDGRLDAFLYEEQQKVYHRLATNNTGWQLLYDFALMPGDIVTDGYGLKHEVERVDTIAANGETFRRIIFKHTNGWQPVWISGVGGRRAINDPYLTLAGDYSHLVACKVGGTTLFEGDEIMLGISSGDPESGIAKIGGLKYRLDDDEHEAMLERENRWTGELAIPSEVTSNGQAYRVTKMKQHAFSGCTTLTRVVLPSTIHSLSGNPFVACGSLEAIEADAANGWLCTDDGVLYSADKTLLYSYPAGAKASNYVAPECLEAVGSQAFSRNPYLKSVKLQGNVTEIASEAFQLCTALEKVELPKGLTLISDNMFRECTSLKDIVIPASVERIGILAFYGCTSLKDIVIPEGVTTLGSNTFMGCTFLTTASLPSTVEAGTDGLFRDCSNLTVVNLADGIRHIGDEMFVNCSSLKKLDLPASIRSIGISTFSGCTMDTLIIRGQYARNSLNKDIFRGMGTSTVLCVHWAEVEKFKEIYSGTVIALNKGVPADSYYPMLTIGKTWNIQESWQDDEQNTQYRNYSLRITGDTIIKGRTYYVMCAEGDDSPLRPDKSFWTESDRKIRCNDLSVIYTFDMKVGSGFVSNGQEDVCVAENCVETQGHLLRQFEIACHDGQTVSWLEGIGNEDCGPLFPFGRNADDGITVTLISVYEGDICIFSRDGDNEQSGMSASSNQVQKPSTTLYDLQGRRLIQKPERGLYIQDGRKVVIK